MTPTVMTIGVYGFDQGTFLTALEDAGVGLLIDVRQGVGKRSRVELAPQYRERYIHEILDRADLEPIVESLPADSVTALLCVERDPEACHRSLIAEPWRRGPACGCGT
ncbi:MAG TPA: DUF488 family protein [Thermoleophilaceae bacterium]|nr:DUF488 family protein [Thermoleophilaceae bacterium]